MGRIKYIKSEYFFAKEYKNGIIVAFKNVGDNSPSYADQIHQIVSKNLGVDLFVSDIVEYISGANSNKDSIKDSLFIYVKNNFSISACGISLCPNKDCIEVKYNSEDVLSIKIKQSNKFWIACILVIICIFGYRIIGNMNELDDLDIIDDPEIELSTKMPIKPVLKDNNVSATGVTIDNKEEATPIITNDTIVATVEVEYEEHIETENNVSIFKQTVTPNIKNTQTVEHPVEDAERDRRSKVKEAVNKYVQIADRAYIDYANSFNESKGNDALINYKKALDSIKKYDISYVREKAKIEKKVSILEKELK